jgi:hypothetical protein
MGIRRDGCAHGLLDIGKPRNPSWKSVINGDGVPARQLARRPPEVWMAGDRSFARRGYLVDQPTAKKLARVPLSH